MDGWTDGWMDGWMDDGWTDGWMDGPIWILSVGVSMTYPIIADRLEARILSTWYVVNWTRETWSKTGRMFAIAFI